MQFNFKKYFFIFLIIFLGNISSKSLVYGEVNSVVKPSQNLSYTPVITPNGSTMPWTVDADGAKVFHLTVETCQHEIAPGMTINAWCYNGQTPGPTIEAVEGDRVRIFVTNKLPEQTAVHWHGVLVPNGMDGVSGLTQKGIQPGEISC